MGINMAKINGIIIIMGNQDNQSPSFSINNYEYNEDGDL